MKYIRDILFRLRILRPNPAPTAALSSNEGPKWRIVRLGNADVYVVVANRGDVVLVAADGSIFHPTRESAEAALETGPMPIFLDGIQTDLVWQMHADKCMDPTKSTYDRGYAFFLNTRGADRRYGNIYVQVNKTDLHAKIAIVPGRYHDEDSKAWAEAETVKINELFERLNVLWSQMMAPERVLQISKYYLDR